MQKKIALSLLITGSETVTLANPQAVMAQQTPPPEVTTNVNNAMGTILVLSPLAQTALSVALLPFAAFLTIAFIQKVMSRV